MNSSLRFLTVVVFVSLLFGCASLKKEEEPAEVDVIETSPADRVDDGSSFGIDTGTSVMFNDIEDALAVRTIYFDYDSSNVNSQQLVIVEAHGRHLAANPDTYIVLEGHADERGSREYNLALGERRAISVKDQMVLLGASENQIRVVSYGEERPAIDDQSEEAWQQNRRVEILY